MRLRTLIKILALGLVAGAILRSQRNRRVTGSGPSRDSHAADPDDPVQRFDDAFELQAEPLDVDVQSRFDMEAAQDLAALEVDLDRSVGEDEIQVELIDVDAIPAGRDAGDLYGAHTPAAVERVRPDDDQSFGDGQNWIEALETSAIENGAEPEQELSGIADDDDLFRAPHRSATRDTPIADLGSGGRRGL